MQEAWNVGRETSSERDYVDVNRTKVLEGLDKWLTSEADGAETSDSITRKEDN
jgi:hypothetical protein